MAGLERGGGFHNIGIEKQTNRKVTFPPREHRLNHFTGPLSVVQCSTPWSPVDGTVAPRRRHAETQPLLCAEQQQQQQHPSRGPEWPRVVTEALCLRSNHFIATIII